MTVGATRTYYCEHDERGTIQRLEHEQRTGAGKVIAERWRCTECGKYVGDIPPKPSSDLENLWDAS